MKLLRKETGLLQRIRLGSNGDKRKTLEWNPRRRENEEDQNSHDVGQPRKNLKVKGRPEGNLRTEQGSESDGAPLL